MKTEGEADQVELAIEDLESIVLLLQEPETSPVPQRRLTHAHIALYAARRRIEHLQPSSAQWERIDNLIRTIEGYLPESAS